LILEKKKRTNYILHSIESSFDLGHWPLDKEKCL